MQRREVRTRVHLRTRSKPRLNGVSLTVGLPSTTASALPLPEPPLPPDLRSGAFSVSFLKKKELKKWQRSRMCSGRWSSMRLQVHWNVSCCMPF